MSSQVKSSTTDLVKHPAFDTPPDANVRIWRYMDFTKFVSMLDNKGLFFSRADLIGDPFEGSYTRQNLTNRKPGFLGLSNEREIDDFFKLIKDQRRYLLLNCWHINQEESAAMWKLYTKSSEAIAIQSRYARLRSNLQTNVEIGVVHYIDYEQDFVPEGNTLYPIMHKRKSFEHERELRAVWWLLADADYSGSSQTLPPPPDSGMWHSVNLDELIEAIYVAPTSPEWFKMLVGKVSLKYDLTKPVLQSKLDDSPLF